MPVSVTSNATTVGAFFSTGCPPVQPPGTVEIPSRTPPCSVNLKAFDSRFFSTCCRRLLSVVRVRRLGSTCTSKNSPRLSASCRNGRVTVSVRLRNEISSASTDTVPDSIFDRSRMSLIRFSRSVPAA